MSSIDIMMRNAGESAYANRTVPSLTAWHPHTTSPTAIALLAGWYKALADDLCATMVDSRPVMHSDLVHTNL